MITLSLGKITIRDAGGDVLGTVERLDDRKYQYEARRIRGYAASHADAVGILRDLQRILPRTQKEQTRGRTRASSETCG